MKLLNNIIAATLLSATLVSCKTVEVRRYPLFVECQVIHPAEVDRPELSNVPMTVIEVDGKKYFAFSETDVEQHFRDEVEKLEFAQLQAKRAEFYKNAIVTCNENALKRNAEILESID